MEERERVLPSRQPEQDTIARPEHPVLQHGAEHLWGACDQEEGVPELEGYTKPNASLAASGQVSHVTFDTKETAGTRRERQKHTVTLDALFGRIFSEG